MAAIGFIVVAFAAAVLIFIKYGRASWNPPDSSNFDVVWLQCQKCGAEFRLTSAKCDELERDPSTGAMKCSKCGELQAVVASKRCPHCKRLIVRQAFGSAYVCPHCKKSLAPGASDGPPNAASPNAGPAMTPTAGSDKL